MLSKVFILINGVIDSFHELFRFFGLQDWRLREKDFLKSIYDNLQRGTRRRTNGAHKDTEVEVAPKRVIE